MILCFLSEHADRWSARETSHPVGAPVLRCVGMTLLTDGAGMVAQRRLADGDQIGTKPLTLIRIGALGEGEPESAALVQRGHVGLEITWSEGPSAARWSFGDAGRERRTILCAVGAAVYRGRRGARDHVGAVVGAQRVGNPVPQFVDLPVAASGFDRGEYQRPAPWRMAKKGTPK
jgi:hypothetical protein